MKCLLRFLNQIKQIGKVTIKFVDRFKQRLNNPPVFLLNYMENRGEKCKTDMKGYYRKSS